MKKIIAALFILFSFNYSSADIIYTHPVRNAERVSINNNIIIGLDVLAEGSELNHLIKVKGSLSGRHEGKFFLTKDKRKIIFTPVRPFAFNEKVEVSIGRIKTSAGYERNLNFSFYTETRKTIRDNKMIYLNETGNTSFKESEQRLDSLNLPVITVSILNNPSPGDLYFSNFPFSQIQNTPYLLITDNNGTVSYHREVYVWALDYKKQQSGLMTYFEYDKFYGEDINHNIIDSFYCGNGYSTDHHELQITNDGHAFLMSYDPQPVDMSLIVPGGNPNAIVTGLIIQELDENKNVVFQWRSWDHFEITDAVHENLLAANIDYAHGNAIEVDSDGNLMISSRNMSEITKIDINTGEIIWRLGGINNEFAFPNDTIGFSYQHDIRRIKNGNITLFDNGNFHTPRFSRAVEYHLDEVNKIATLVWQYRKTPDTYAFAMGSVQRLRNGNTLIGWGNTNPFLTEVTPAGITALEMSLPQGIYSYRVYRDERKFTLNAKIAIEGFYNENTGHLNINDTVTVYLRNVNSPYNIVDTAKSVVDSVSHNGNFNFYNAASGRYYIQLKHRNALETWSKKGGEIFSDGDVLFYDFTDSDRKAFGNNQTLKGSDYCLYSGDANQDGIIDLADLSEIDSDIFNFRTGYNNSDLTGDNFTDINDVSVADNNAYEFVTAVIP
ncbi:MAG TPA: aryl-sulfate sulfotransferase [Ignavibacteria bacterium]|nr:hypothetical protein [Bacteroidota bacterium]HRI86456.1 aryl-sulfate sulfotransferase [Ignavibacteria bacterium]HRJ99858.1 aryl-sulfate sulfotransferase [Ignavibacteria bacterium]